MCTILMTFWRLINEYYNEDILLIALKARQWRDKINQGVAIKNKVEISVTFDNRCSRITLQEMLDDL